MKCIRKCLNMTLHMWYYHVMSLRIWSLKVIVDFGLSARAKIALMLHELQTGRKKVCGLVSPKLMHFNP